MATHHVTVYGEGGYNPSKPNGNVVEEYDVETPDSVVAPPGPNITALAQAILASPSIDQVTKDRMITALGGGTP